MDKADNPHRIAEAGKGTQWGKEGAPKPGRPKGARDRFTTAFMNDLAEVWREYGKQAMVACATEEPSVFYRVGATLMPKEFALSSPLDALSDEKLDQVIAILEAMVAAQADESEQPQPTVN